MIQAKTLVLVRRRTLAALAAGLAPFPVARPIRRRRIRCPPGMTARASGRCWSLSRWCRPARADGGCRRCATRYLAEHPQPPEIATVDELDRVVAMVHVVGLTERGMYDMTARIALLVLALAAGTIASPRAMAGEAEAKALLKAMSDYMAAQQAISFEYDATYEVVTK